MEGLYAPSEMPPYSLHIHKPIHPNPFQPEPMHLQGKFPFLYCSDRIRQTHHFYTSDSLLSYRILTVRS